MGSFHLLKPPFTPLLLRSAKEKGKKKVLLKKEIRKIIAIITITLKIPSARISGQKGTQAPNKGTLPRTQKLQWVLSPMAAPSSANALKAHVGGPCSPTGEEGQGLPQIHRAHALSISAEEQSRPSPVDGETEAPMSSEGSFRPLPIFILYFQARCLSY